MTTVRGEAQADPDVGAELAVRAWERLRPSLGCPGRVTPTGIVRLKRQRRPWHKTAVYRLEGVGPDGSAVIGKRCRLSSARVERTAYEKILPRIPLPRVEYYGCVEEELEDFCWLFLADAGSRKPTMADRALVGEWLARLQAAAAPLAGDVALPDRGPDHIRGLLPRTRAGVLKAREFAPLSRFDCELLQTMADTLDRLATMWDRVSAACEAWPRTLVHADFTRKNVRLCPGDGGVHVVALDWETAGCGPPAADLADVPWGRARNRFSGDGPPPSESETPWYGPVCLDTYAATIAEFWPAINRADVQRLSRVGSIFRVIDAASWASRQVEFGGIDKGMYRLEAYADDLQQAVATLDD
jgi:hypothetical protein